MFVYSRLRTHDLGVVHTEPVGTSKHHVREGGEGEERKKGNGKKERDGKEGGRREEWSERKD